MGTYNVNPALGTTEPVPGINPYEAPEAKTSANEERRMGMEQNKFLLDLFLKLPEIAKKTKKTGQVETNILGSMLDSLKEKTSLIKTPQERAALEDATKFITGIINQSGQKPTKAVAEKNKKLLTDSGTTSSKPKSTHPDGTTTTLGGKQYITNNGVWEEVNGK
jgi:hypothetical protein